MCFNMSLISGPLLMVSDFLKCYEVGDGFDTDSIMEIYDQEVAHKSKLFFAFHAFV